NYAAQLNLGVGHITEQTDGKLIHLSISNNTFYTTPVGQLIRLNPDLSIDATFNSGTGISVASFGIVNKPLIQPDGKILLSGNFSAYNGVPTGKLIRINNDGSLDAGFTAALPANNIVRFIAQQPDGKIITTQ